MNIIIKKAIESVKTLFVALVVKTEEEFAQYFSNAFANSDKAIGKCSFVGNGVCYMKVWHTTHEETSNEGITTKTGASLLLVCKGEYDLNKDSKYYIDLSDAEVVVKKSDKDDDIRAYITGAKIS